MDDQEKVAQELKAALRKMFMTCSLVKQIVLVANKRGKEVGSTAEFPGLDIMINTGHVNGHSVHDNFQE